MIDTWHTTLEEFINSFIVCQARACVNNGKSAGQPRKEQKILRKLDRYLTYGRVRKFINWVLNLIKHPYTKYFGITVTRKIENRKPTSLWQRFPGRPVIYWLIFKVSDSKSANGRQFMLHWFYDTVNGFWKCEVHKFKICMALTTSLSHGNGMAGAMVTKGNQMQVLYISIPYANLSSRFHER